MRDTWTENVEVGEMNKPWTFVIFMSAIASAGLAAASLLHQPLFAAAGTWGAVAGIVAGWSGKSLPPEARTGNARFLQARGLRTTMIVIGILGLLLPFPDLVGFASESPAEGVPFGVPLVAYSALCIFRFSRAGVLLEDEGITVVNDFATRRLPWADIAEFTWGRSGLMLKLIAVLKNGKRLGLAGLPVGGAGIGETSTTAKALQLLQEKLRESQSAV